MLPSCRRLLATLLLLAAAAVGAADPAIQKAVYHVGMGERPAQKFALRNIQNHIDAVGRKNIDLRMVVVGDGVTLLQRARSDEDLKAAIDSLKLLGVTIHVCRDTLAARKLDYRKDLYDVTAADLVPSGVAEIARLQMLGYAYVKP
jgi:uncharacterized protein